MTMPKDVPIIDTQIGFPTTDKRAMHASIIEHTKDAESKEQFKHPADYMFVRDVPEEITETEDPVAVTLREMDTYNIQRGLIGIKHEVGQRALREHPDRFVGALFVDPNEGMDAVRGIVRAKDQFDIRAVDIFPAGLFPQVAINDKKMYPIYAKCVELGISVWVNAGVPGPRLRMDCQKVEYIDEVMYDFPELVFVTRHGCEPWEDLAVKLMLKWPGLHYCTSAFAPKYYPEDIIRYANTRGADKIIWSGYFPAGLTYDRLFSELPDVPFRDQVWPKFLRENAVSVFKLDR